VVPVDAIATAAIRPAGPPPTTTTSQDTVSPVVGVMSALLAFRRVF
jgi:hypothetical protein